jgi:ribosomal protein S28E/S33
MKMEQNRFIVKDIPKPVQYEDILLEEGGVTKFRFKNFLQVTFEDPNVGSTFNYRGKLNSTMSLRIETVDLDDKGRVIDPSVVLLEGHWATQLLGDLLPLDYVVKKE